MKKIIKSTKWWMWIPILNLILSRKMAYWILEPDTFYERAEREIYSWFFVMETILVILWIMTKLHIL